MERLVRLSLPALVLLLAAGCTGDPRHTIEPELFFIYVKVPEAIGPLDRAERYEDPIQARLDERALGEVSGGGTQLGEVRPDGTRPIEFCGIDVDVVDLDAGLELLREALPELGAPPGTQLLYERDSEQRQDELAENGWSVGILSSSGLEEPE